MISKRKQLDEILEYAAERDIIIPADILLDIGKRDMKELLSALQIKLKLKPSDLPIYTMTLPGAVPAPIKRGLILTSKGWDDMPQRQIYTGVGGVTAHQLLNNLSYALSGHTGFQSTLIAGVDYQAPLTFPLAANLGGTGIANLAASTLTLGAATSVTGGGTVGLGGFTLTVPATGTAALLATANVFTTQQMVDGTSDQIQLRVQGHATQTTHLQTWENSAAAEQITFDVPTQNTATLGTELITNGNFDTNLSSWTTYGPISTVAVNAPGNGYNVGDVLTVVQTGGALGTLTVATLTGGAGTGVATVTLLAAGTGYTAATGLATTVAPAGGTNCTIDILTITGWAWNAGQNATRAVVAGTGAITQSINLTNGTTYQVTITLVRTAGTLTESFGTMVGSYDFTSSQTVSRTFKATATAAFILTFTPTATFGGSIDSVSVKAITGGITANVSFNNTDGSYGMELRAGGIGLNNSFMGYRAGYYNTTGYYNSAQGYQALYNNTAGYYNSAQGYAALYSNTTGYQNSAQGVNALYSNTTGNNNAAQGYAALYYNTTGYQNSAQGMYALYNNTTGYQNSAQGVSALYNNTAGYYNSAQGVSALYSNTTGNNNAAQGYAALYYNTTGYYNSAQGVYALYSNTTGNSNAAQGYAALYYNTTGNNNAAQGYAALYNLKPTSKAITSFADYSATVAGTVKATSVGHGLSGATTKEITGTVNYNGSKSVTVIDVDNFYFTATWVATETGWWSIVTEGRYNTGIGYSAGRTLTTADSCTFIGYNAGYHASQLATATNSTAIGNGAYTAASNQIVLGNTSVTTFGIGTYNPTAHVQFTGVSDLIGLRILGNATQTTNLFTLETSASVVLHSVSVTGITSILSTVAGALVIGAGTAGIDYNVTFNGETNDGVITWMEDEDYFQFGDAVRLPAGTAALAPLMFQTGTLLTTPVAGAMEFYDGRWYITGTAKQRVIDRTGGVIVATTTVANTAVETTIWTETLSANAMRAGRIYKFHCDGIISNHSNDDDITFNFYVGGTLLATVTPTLKTYANATWHTDFEMTIRTIGMGGTSALHGDVFIGTLETLFESLQAVDTTATNAITLKVKWNTALAANTISIYQGWLELKN